MPLAIIEQTRRMHETVPRQQPWGSYVAYDGETPVGLGAFKSGPAGNVKDPEDGLVWQWRRSA